MKYGNSLYPRQLSACNHRQWNIHIFHCLWCDLVFFRFWIFAPFTTRGNCVSQLAVLTWSTKSNILENTGWIQCSIEHWTGWITKTIIGGFINNTLWLKTSRTDSTIQQQNVSKSADRQAGRCPRVLARSTAANPHIINICWLILPHKYSVARLRWLPAACTAALTLCEREFTGSWRLVVLPDASQDLSVSETLRKNKKPSWRRITT